MPQPFKDAVVTDAGVQLLAKAQAGEIKIEFTRIETGNGIYEEREKDPEHLKAMAGLKSAKNSVPLSGVSVHSENSVKVSALITNFDPVTQETVIADGYYINEMGLFAKEKDGEDGTEVLYSIAVTAGETGDYMPPYNGCSPVQIIQDYYVTVSNSAEVTVQGGAGAPALADDLRAVERKMEQKLENYRVIRILARKDAVTSYIGFASLPLPSAAGRSEVTLLISGTGNTGSPLCGTYLVQCGTKDHVSMAVAELIPPGSDGDILFGYWQKSDRVIFGMKRGPYNYHTNIAMVSEDVSGDGAQKYEIAELHNSTAKPAGWTDTAKRKFLALDGNAVSATKAVQDGNGRVIADTYATNAGLEELRKQISLIADNLENQGYVKEIIRAFHNNLWKTAQVSRGNWTELGGYTYASLTTKTETTDAINGKKKIAILFTDGSLGVFGMATDRLNYTDAKWMRGSVPYVNKTDLMGGKQTLAIAGNGGAYSFSGSYGPILEMSHSNNLKTKYIFV